MKMPIELYNELAADIQTVAEDIFPEGTEGLLFLGEMRDLFNLVMRDRMYDDAHPGFSFGRGPWTRVLPHWSRNGESAGMQGNDHWLNRFYVEADLNDDHINTALKKIAKTLK